MIEVPSTIEEIIAMTKGININHKGLHASLKSLQAGRSPKNAYILVLGTSGAGKSASVSISEIQTV